MLFYELDHQVWDHQKSDQEIVGRYFELDLMLFNYTSI